MIKNNWIDISTGLYNNMPVWPGDVPFQLQSTCTIEEGANCNVSAIHCSVHIGTHVDAPRHFLANGEDVGTYSFDQLIGTVRILSFNHEGDVCESHLIEHNIMLGERIIIRCNKHLDGWENKPFSDQYYGLTNKGAQYLASKEIIFVGIDYLTIGNKEESTMVHQTLSKHFILITEGLVLKGLEDGNYEMICMPLKIVGSDGSPARVLLKKIV